MPCSIRPGINDAGDIVGFGLTSGGDIHAFLARPLDCRDDNECTGRDVTRQPIIPEYVRDMIRARLGGPRQ